MAMNLKFKNRYLSISQFPEISLPQFTLITGVNGTGKSHLLGAIAEGKIQVEIEGSTITPGDIKLFDWNQLKPRNSKSYVGNSAGEEREKTIQNIIQKQQELKERLRTHASKVSYPLHILEPENLAAITESELHDQLEGSVVPNSGISVFLKLREQLEAPILNAFPGHARAGVTDFTASEGIRLSTLTREQISNLIPPNWGSSEAFQHDFGKLFVTYRDLKLKNSNHSAAE